MWGKTGKEEILEELGLKKVSASVTYDDTVFPLNPEAGQDECLERWDLKSLCVVSRNILFAFILIFVIAIVQGAKSLKKRSWKNMKVSVCVAYEYKQ